MNRVTAYAEKLQTQLSSLNGVGVNGQPLDDAFEATFDITIEDFIGYQNAQSRAFASGKINFEEAQTVYTVLGGGVFLGNWKKGTSLAMRIAVTRMVGELIGAV